MDLSGFARHPRLNGASVFVTGGGSGIGAAIVDVARDASEALCAKLAGQYGRAPLFIACDISDIAALRDAITRAGSELGDIGTLVNNAANDQRHDWQEVTPGYWDERMAINLRPMFFAIQAVVPQMLRLGS